MPAHHSDWLIEHFHRFNAGDDPGFMARYLRQVRIEARRLDRTDVELLDTIEGIAALAATTPTIVDAGTLI
jgi:hypothetical protein